MEVCDELKHEVSSLPPFLLLPLSLLLLLQMLLEFAQQLLAR